MRELTKSFVSFSWALSLLGIKQATNLLSPGRPNNFEPVAQAAANQLDPSMQGLFRTGDNLQRGVVNAMFGMLDPRNWNPSRWAPGAGQPGAGGQSGVSSGAGGSSCCGQPSQGWGPITPPAS